MHLPIGQQQPVYDSTVLIVVRAKIESNERITGLIMDHVSDVMNAGGDKIRYTPDIVTGSILNSSAGCSMSMLSCGIRISINPSKKKKAKAEPVTHNVLIYKTLT